MQQNTPHVPSLHALHGEVSGISDDELVGALMRCLRTSDGLNTSTRRAGIGVFSPVLGLRPIRCRLLRTTKEPKDDSFTDSPRSRQFMISLNTNSTKAVDCARGRRALTEAEGLSRRVSYGLPCCDCLRRLWHYRYRTTRTSANADMSGKISLRCTAPLIVQ